MNALTRALHRLGALRHQPAIRTAAEPARIRSVRNTGDATATNGGYANTGAVSDARRNIHLRQATLTGARAAAHVNALDRMIRDWQNGPVVTLPREVANYLENGLIDWRHHGRFPDDDVRNHAALRLLSDAIDTADRKNREN